MSSGRRSLPIRWRLALISAALTLVILSVFAIVVGELTSGRIRSDFNGQLVTAADDLQTRVTVTVDPLSQKIVTHRPTLDVYAAPEHAAIRIVLLPSGKTLDATKHVPVLLPYQGGGTSGDQLGYRVVQRVIPVKNAESGITIGAAAILYARKLSDVDATVGRVRFFLVFGVIGGTLAALLGGVLLARRAMRPIEQLTSTAQEIADTRDPSQRIPQPQADDEIAELARTLDTMLQALEASRRENEAVLARQRQFVADASHELRTPLTSVLVNLEMLSEVLEGDRGEAARSALRSSRRMRRLVSDLLLLARADARREQPHAPTDLSQVLVEAAAELEPVIGAHRLSVEAAPNAWIDGARDDLHRLILNLMENAVRHTPDGTAVRASVTVADDDVVVTVTDDGPGIPPELRDKVFERFVRGAGDSGKSFGLGLSIVKAVADTHHGRVSIEDAHPGARFVVRFARLPAPAGTTDTLWSTAAPT